jgi:hypothetical protein
MAVTENGLLQLASLSCLESLSLIKAQNLNERVLEVLFTLSQLRSLVSSCWYGSFVPV